MKKISILFIILVLFVSCKNENFLRKDFVGSWENSSTLKTELFEEPENQETLFATVYTKSKMLFIFNEDGTFEKQIQNEITKIDLDKEKIPENFSIEVLETFIKKNQIDGGKFFIKNSVLFLEQNYHIENDEIKEIDTVIPINLNFEFSQNKQELILTFSDSQKITLKKISF